MARPRGSASRRRLRRASNNDEEGESISSSIYSPDKVVNSSLALLKQ